MVILPDPEIQGDVDLFQGIAVETGKELGADCAEEPFDLAPSLGCIGRGVDQGNAQGSADPFQMSGAEGGAVIYIMCPFLLCGRPNLTTYNCMDEIEIMDT